MDFVSLQTVFSRRFLGKKLVCQLWLRQQRQLLFRISAILEMFGALIAAIGTKNL